MGNTITVGVIGSGHISDIYLTNMIGTFQNLTVKGLASAHFENAKKKADKYQIIAYESVEALLADPEIQMTVILTPAPTHYGLIRQSLLAGKHVYTEKTITTKLSEAKELLSIAAEKNLYLGSAPDTFLGGAYQTARKLIDSGVLGEITSFQVMTNRNLDFLTSLFTFLRMPGGGILPDYGVYYLTCLVSLLGPVKEVSAITKNPKPVRTNCIPTSPEFGQDFAYTNESQIYALMELESGVNGTFAVNGDSILCEMPDFKILGTKGILELTDANTFGGSLKLTLPGEDFRPVTTVIEPEFTYTENSRGVGPSEMADAILSGTANRASCQMAYHVLDIIETMYESAEKKAYLPVASSCERPAGFADGKKLMEK